MEIGAEAELFPEKEYISRIFVAVRAGKAALLASWTKMTRPGEFCLVMVGLEAVPCVLIFPVVKHCSKACVHLHRKYSIDRHE